MTGGDGAKTFDGLEGPHGVFDGLSTLHQEVEQATQVCVRLEAGERLLQRRGPVGQGLQPRLPLGGRQRQSLVEQGVELGPQRRELGQVFRVRRRLLVRSGRVSAGDRG